MSEQRPDIVSVGGDQYNAGRDQFIGNQSVVITNIEAERSYDVQGLPNPYLGLKSFTYSQRDIFAGRERAVAAAVATLTNPASPLPLLVITGASGAGKSSFAQAGLLPALAAYYDQRHVNVRYAVFRPVSQPLVSLADALIQMGLAPGLAADVLSEIDTPAGFNQFVSAHTPREQVNVLIIDQFEELFSQAEATQRDTLFAILEQLAPFKDTHTHIVATLRVDYLPSLFQRPSLYNVAKSGVDLRAMTVDELKQAIQRPVQQLYPDKQFEPALVERLARDAATDASYLPLLQVTLEQIWKDGWLKLAAYHDLTSSIRDQAEIVYTYDDYSTTRQHFRPPAEQNAILQMMLDLVHVSPTADFPDVRERRSRRALAKGNPLRERLIDDLCAARLLSTDTDTPGGEVQIDIIHESLIKNWQRLQEAIKEQRGQLITRERFERQLDEWVTNGKSDQYLLSGIHLAEAKQLAAAGDVAMHAAVAREMIRRSEAEQEAIHQRELIETRRRLRRARVTTLAISVFLIIALVASYFAYINAEQANRSAAEVALHLRVSESQRLADSAETLLQSNRTEQALLLAQEATARDDNEISRAALRDAVDVTVNPLASFTGHSGPVYSAAFSPDGKMLVTASADKTARLWDTSGKLLATLSGHSDVVNGARFSPDGNTILTASQDGTARLWDTSGKLLLTLSGHSKGIGSATFSPDGKRIVTASQDGTARLWDTSGKLLLTLSGHQSAVNSAVFSPDGSRILTASSDKTARLWDSSGKLLATFSGHTDAVNGAVFSPDGNRILTYSNDAQALLWDSSGKMLAAMHGHSNWIVNASFSRDGKHILTASQDGTARLWDSDGHSIAILDDHAGPIYSASFSHDGSRVVTGGADSSAALWDIDGSRLAILSGQSDGLNFVAFSPDDSRIVTTAQDGTARLWDSNTELIISFSGHTDHIKSLAYSADGSKMVTASVDKTARLWEVSSGKLLATLSGHSDAVTSAAFSPDGSKIVTASADGTARVWDSSGKLLATLNGHSGPVNSAVFNPAGNNIVTASADSTAKLWDSSGKLLATLSGHSDGVNSAVFSPDGSRILTASADHTARLWDASGKPLATLSGHTRPVLAAHYSPDGTHIATASIDHTARLWDKDGKLIATLSDHTNFVRDALFSPDSSLLLTISADKTARLWTADGKPVAMLAGQSDQLIRAAFSPDGKTLLTVSIDGSTDIWDTTGKLQTAIRGQSWAFSPDGSRVLAEYPDYVMELIPTRVADLRAIAACRVTRALTSQELSRYNIDQAMFKYDPAQCPAQASWQK